MRKFLKNVLVFSLPFFMLIVIYIATDVFRVIYHYDPYYNGSYYIPTNRAYGSTMTYLNQNPNYHYDSFIFGNSRSLFYEVDTWKKYLPKGSKCMHFDEFGGSISGVHDKVLFIDKNGGRIKNALLVIDHAMLSRLEMAGYLFASPPILKGYSNFFSFHIQHFSAFLTPKFLVALADYNIFGEFRPYMKDIISNDHHTYVAEYNELQRTKAEKEIKEGIYYDAKHLNVFKNVQKPGTFSNEKLGSKEINCLQEMKNVFDKQHTSYKIVISPLYDQIKLNKESHSILCEIFGKENIYDFSGVNEWNKDYHNYYENSHYRPLVSAEIMGIIYSDNNN